MTPRAPHHPGLPRPHAGRTGPRAALGVVALSGLALTACGGGDDASAEAQDGEITGSVTLQTWALTPSYTDYLDDVIEAFEEAHPGTEVTLLDQPGDGYSDQVLTQAAAGELPDVVNLPPDFALPLAQEGMLLDVAAADETLRDTYVEGGIQAYEFEGLEGVYGYPWYLNTDINYWNIDKLESCGLDPENPPADLDELFEQAAVMHDECDGEEHLISARPGLGTFTLAGIEILDDAGDEFVFAVPEAVEILDRYRDAYAEGHMPSQVLNDDYLGNATMFTEGQVAWTTGGGTAMGDFITNNPSLEGNVAVSPALDTPPLYVQGFSVAADSDNPATALALAQWFTNAENQEAFAAEVNIFPSTIASEDSEELAESDGTPEDDARVLAFESISQAEVVQPFAINEAMTDYFNQQLSLAISGDITSEEALETAQERMNQLLD
ncbi:ABC transporter substrate-binding protein [Nesterenkonia xinjiangensis]|uniref:Multiple sugar transport system substrate-binding protein n=1 Tax=Nesterenkonia xinjiangensis TaxID=225327 RepID=A0A7Z0GL33_9MICC|nr:extracellular solute-binding protein [Nesterenkonia xinjiangensis]NYJ77101.1 multiple sugar transport system substrate-binding protein [Nesterenkonia xinjiangensis]